MLFLGPILIENLIDNYFSNYLHFNTKVANDTIDLIFNQWSKYFLFKNNDCDLWVTENTNYLRRCKSLNCIKCL